MGEKLEISVKLGEGEIIRVFGDMEGTPMPTCPGDNPANSQINITEAEGIFITNLPFQCRLSDLYKRINRSIASRVGMKVRYQD